MWQRRGFLVDDQDSSTRSYARSAVAPLELVTNTHDTIAQYRNDAVAVSAICNVQLYNYSSKALLVSATTASCGSVRERLRGVSTPVHCTAGTYLVSTY